MLFVVVRMARTVMVQTFESNLELDDVLVLTPSSFQAMNVYYTIETTTQEHVDSDLRHHPEI
jgi:hypothetical protein